MKKNLSSLPILVVLITCIACNSSGDKKTGKTDSSGIDKKLEDDTPGSIWKSLFDGRSLAGWHGFNKTGEVTNWAIEDSALVCLGIAKDAQGGDLVSDNEYENFELTWDWKISKGGNSGLIYHAVESPAYKAPWETGPEYQLIDDVGFPQRLEVHQTAGADYGMYSPAFSKRLKPVGEWNSSRLIFNKGHVEHWINGNKVVEFEMWSEEWNKKKAAGKWKDYPDYGKAKKGKIALQDHGDKVYFKNIMIREL